ncbi:MAG: hypothetical protein ACK6DZ_17455 [Acidobacteriota bacterium]
MKKFMTLALIFVGLLLQGCAQEAKHAEGDGHDHRKDKTAHKEGDGHDHSEHAHEKDAKK